METLDQGLWSGSFVLQCDEAGIDGYHLKGEDAFLCVPFEVDSLSVYRVNITVRNIDGNGRLDFDIYIDEEHAFPPATLRFPVDPWVWQTFEVDVTTARCANGSLAQFRVLRTSCGTGTVLVKNMEFRKLPRGIGPNPSPRLLCQKCLDLFQAPCEFQVVGQYAAITETNMYELDQQAWRGRSSIAKRDEHGLRCYSLDGEKAILFVPVKVEPNSMYRLQLELKRETGNGKLFCNFYGNRNFDFPHSGFVCEATSWSIFDVQIKVGSFPANIPIVLRFWRSPGGTGSLLVKRIAFEPLQTEVIMEEPKLVASTSTTLGHMSVIPLPEINPPPSVPQSPRALPPPLQLRPGTKASIVYAYLNPEGLGIGPDRLFALRTKTADYFRLSNHTPIDGIKVSTIISMCDNRTHMFERALDTWVYQSLPKKEWELIVVDDALRDDVRILCQSAANTFSMNIQFVRIDKSRSTIPVKSFLPVLTNNVGFRKARGSVVVVTGPETLQGPRNLENALKIIDSKQAAYGLVYKATQETTDRLAKEWPLIKNDFARMIGLPNITWDALPSKVPGAWHLMAVERAYVDFVRGVDERFLGGICAEDNDFANRLWLAGAQPTNDANIVGIHQNHFREDENDPAHHNYVHNHCAHERERNLALLKSNILSLEPIVNPNHDWGGNHLITMHESYFCSISNGIR